MFQDLGLAHPLLESIAALGFASPTPIQQGAIPIIREGHDLIGVAKTGSGKTLAYALPLIDVLSRAEDAHSPRALIIAPARELADQVELVIRGHADSLGLRSAVFVGGDSKTRQLAALEAGVDIAVGTPGRLVELATQGSLRLDKIKVFTIDEVDRVLQGNMCDDVQRLVSFMPVDHQTLLLSATLPTEVRAFARTLQKDARLVEVDCDLPATIRHCVIRVESRDRFAALVQVLQQENPKSCFVFVNSKDETERLAMKLDAFGIRAESFSSNLELSQRRSRLQHLRDGQTFVVVATDVLGRGIDIVDMDLVINFGIARNADNYIHRSGRTGRAGREGKVISIVNHDERRRMRTFLERKGIALEDLTVECGLPEISAPQVQQVVFESVAVPPALQSRFAAIDEGLSQLVDRAFRKNLRLDLKQGYPIIEWSVSPSTEITSLEAMYAPVVTAASSHIEEVRRIWRGILDSQERVLPWTNSVAQFAAHIFARQMHAEGADRNVLLSVANDSPHRERWIQAIEAAEKAIPEYIAGPVRIDSSVPELQVRESIKALIVRAEREQIPMTLSFLADIHMVRVNCTFQRPPDLTSLRELCLDLAEATGWAFEIRPLVVERLTPEARDLAQQARKFSHRGRPPFILSLSMSQQNSADKVVDVLVSPDALPSDMQPFQASLQSLYAHLNIQIAEQGAEKLSPPEGTSYLKLKSPRKREDSEQQAA
ncbi:MAG: DEAD/DEAH box helicase [Deltaproteobacteria bacterium]|nr:DEAD/DEAH box helicase [Deltaproteobacteria bacterium]